MRFIHAADIHLDSPLRGLDSYPGAPIEQLRIATRQAFERVIELCLENRVDFLIIAGDLFDSAVKDFHAALAAAAQLRRLEQAGIPVYVILGNHDPRDEAVRRVPWPENVTLFDHQQAHTVRHPALAVALHAMSYPTREVSHNLVPNYPPSAAGCFNIGILHTNANGNSQHAPYAPCSIDDLSAKGYGYWALGHVHEFAVLHERPHIVYSGNTQGRHIRETGPKGCLLVEVDQCSESGEVVDIVFCETDVVRWFHLTIPLQPGCDEDELLDVARCHLSEIAGQAEGRIKAIRLEFTGRCAVHTLLSKDALRQQLIAHLRGLASDISSDLWIEKVHFHTQAPIDVEALRQRQDLIGQLLRESDSLAMDPQTLLALPETKDLIAKVASELSQDIDGSDSLDLDDPERHITWLRNAEALLLGHLVSEKQEDA